MRDPMPLHDDPSAGKTALVLGSGGREHALAWALSRSEQVARVVVAPGNAGMPAAEGSISTQPLDLSDHQAVTRLALELSAALVVIGPEAPLADGLADTLRRAGLAVFGPGQDGARLEASKAFAKAFMARHDIPTARAQVCYTVEAALSALRAAPYPIVIKADGLAAGKGVFLPDSQDEAEAIVRQLMSDRALGDAGDALVIEERLEGVELSLIGLCDGTTARALPAAQDHKRALAGDRGPNTGGMGAIAPVPSLTAAEHAHMAQVTLQRALDGLRADGFLYRGALYAGIMWTADGPRVLEYNCRFGDPEAQALLPLIDEDLFARLLACARGEQGGEVVVREGASAVVVATSAGYPGTYTKGHEVVRSTPAPPDALTFYAGVSGEAERLKTSGGRVLGVCGLAPTLRGALARAYEGLETIQFEGMTWREDIGWRAHERPVARASAYAAAGVSLDAGARAVALMRAAIDRTHGPEVLAGVGSFGGLFDAVALKAMAQPVLVASTDGVGTKTVLAAALGRVEHVGADLVNHCVNDILVQGARPLMFLDYIASARLDPEQIADVVSSCARACEAAGCALIGGETAELPGVYHEGAFDLVGTIIGAVERERVITGEAIQVGDVVLALPSSGLHTNGFSLARRVIEGVTLDAFDEALGAIPADALLAPHRSYLPEITAALNASVPIHGMAHVTGGGLIDNSPRILPDGCAIRLDRAAWQVPALFGWLGRLGAVEARELWRVFNMGLGMLIVVPRQAQARALDALGPDALAVGEVIARDGDPVEISGGWDV